MILLDEHVRDDQRALLRRAHIPFRQVGREVSLPGIQDENILPLLLRPKRPTLFTEDRDFFQRHFCHSHYCLVWLDVRNTLVADYIRRFLRHPGFHHHRQRMGRVMRVRPVGLDFWQIGSAQLHSTPWPLQ